MRGADYQVELFVGEVVEEWGVVGDPCDVFLLDGFMDLLGVFC